MNNRDKQKNNWMECDVGYLVENNILHKPLDGNHGGIHPKSADFVASGIPFVMASDVSDFQIDLTNCSFISKTQADTLQKGFSLTGDVLLTHKGSVGGTAIVPKIDTEYIMLTPQVTYYRVKDSSRLNSYFIFSYFQSSKFQGYLKSVSGGGTRAYIGITAQLSLPFILPPISEQDRVVSVLKTWDRAIEKLKRKIEIKRQNKRGLMQGLLSGSLRLPNFTYVWETYELQKLVKSFSTGLNPRKNFKLGVGNNFYITIKNFSKGRFDFSSAELVDDSAIQLINKRSKLAEGDVIMSSIGNVGVAHLITENPQGWDINESVFALKPNQEKLQSQYLFYLLSSENTRKYFEANITGSSFKSIKMKDLKAMSVSIPNLVEQKEIVCVLSAVDKEVYLLEDKLQKLQDQKRYLLNNLITGAIRTPETLSISK